MRVLVQRSLSAHVEVEGATVGSIDRGLVLLVGFTEGDTEKEIEELATKVLHLRIFDDEQGIMNRSILDTGGSILCISQFTLYASTKKGNRPSYKEALPGSLAEPLYEKFCQELQQFLPVARGRFGSSMQVHLVNDGPVTILLESRNSHVKESAGL